MNVSVVIPTYNRYKLLKRAIESLYKQTCLPDEIIVVDDGSTDETVAIQNDFPEIIYIYQENRGVSAARNVGIQRAKNEWIAFLDSDDAWHSEKLQKQIDFHIKNSNILMSYTDEVWIRNGKNVKIPKKYKKIGKDIFLENISYCNIAPSSVLMHKKLFKQYGLFDEELPVCEDYDMWLRIAIEQKIALINEKLINKYAGHDEQLGFTKNMEKYRIYTLEKIADSISSCENRFILEKELHSKKRNQKKI